MNLHFKIIAGLKLAMCLAILLSTQPDHKMDELEYFVERNGCPENYCPRAWHKYQPTLMEYINFKYNGIDLKSELE